MKMRKHIKRVYAPPTSGPGGRAGEHEDAGVDNNTLPRSPESATQLPHGPAPTFYKWSIQRLSEETTCVMEPSYTCVPLEDDPICDVCYRTLTEEGE